jgi:hypothetical protein
MLIALSLLACSDEDNTDDTAAAEVCTNIVYTDADGDGWGDLETVELVCDLEADHVTVGGDCDDANPEATPDRMWFLDADGDGYGDPDAQVASCLGQAGLVDDSSDCDDLSAANNPDGVETCDGADNDCDGTADEEATDAPTWYADIDEDGYGDADHGQAACESFDGRVADATDCDDHDAEVNPEGTETCDGVDNDCDGATDFDGWIPADYSTLAAAMTAVPDGAHFCVDEGEHDAQDLTYEGDLILDGAGSALTILSANSGVFLEIEGDLTLNDLALTDLSADDEDSRSIGIHQLQGNTSLTRVDLSDATINGVDDAYNDYAVFVYCRGPGDLTLTDVTVSDVTWNNTPDNYQNTSELFNCWGGDLNVDGLVIEDLSATAMRQDSLLDFWGNSASVSKVEVRNVNSYLSGLYVYMWGPIDVAATYAVTVSDVLIEDNTFEMSTDDDTYYAYVYGGLFGLVSSDSGDAVVQRVEVRNNAMPSNGDITQRGGVFYSYSDGLLVQNVIVANNTFGDTETSYPLFYGQTVTLENADIVDNDFGSTEDLGGLLFAYDNFSVMNANFVGNAMAADSVDAVWGQIGDEDDEWAWAYNNIEDNEMPDGYALASWAGDEVEGTDGMAVDPGYTDRDNGDYTLTSTSALIDAGSSDIEDADGTVSDVGAHGGENAW